LFSTFHDFDPKVDSYKNLLAKIYDKKWEHLEFEQSSIIKIQKTWDSYREFINGLICITNCDPEVRVKLAETLKKHKKSTCMVGNNIGESFGMLEADVSMTLHHSGMDAVKLSSDFIVGKNPKLKTNFNLIFDALKLSRNVYENIRKFM